MHPPIPFTATGPLRARIFTAFSALAVTAILVVGCQDRGPTELGSEGTRSLGPPASPLAQESDPVPPILVEALTARHEFGDIVAIQVRNRAEGRPTTVLNLHDASRIAVLRITIQPGARFPWHTHPGPVLVAVVEGEMTYMYADDCVPRVYPAGGAFVDPGFDNVHAAFNHGEVPMVLVATFLGVPSDGPLTIGVSAEEGAALDARCGAGAAGFHLH
jgi:quercetin dioxygenase-like cupin family protein